MKYTSNQVRIITNATIIYRDKAVLVKVFWDTGATRSCISKSIADELGIKADRHVPFEAANGTSYVNAYYVDIELPGKYRIEDVLVCEAKFDESEARALIGMDIMVLGEACISNGVNGAAFTFRIPGDPLKLLKDCDNVLVDNNPTYGLIE